MASIKSVAVIGANGNLGQAILPSILKASFDVTVITREQSTAVFPSNVEVVKTEYTVDKLTKVLNGQDAVLCLINPGALNVESLVIDAAAAARVKWFIPSEFGHNTMDERVLETLPPLKGKVKLISQLREKEEQGLHWTGIVTGLFFDWGLAMGVLGFDVAKRTAKIWDDGNTKFLATNVDDIATSLVTLLRNADVRKRAKNKYVHISSFVTSQNEILVQLERASGASFTVSHLESDAIKKHALAEVGTGNSNAAVQLIQYVALGGDGLSQWYSEAEQGKKLLLLDPQETLEQTVQRVVKEVMEGRKSLM